METLGNRLTMLRKKKGHTQASMAKELEMSRSNYGGYEVDRILPPSDILRKIADILGTSTDYLLGNTDSSLPADAEDRFIDSLDLADESILEKFHLTFEGKALTPEQMRMAINIFRAVKNQ